MEVWGRKWWHTARASWSFGHLASSKLIPQKHSEEKLAEPLERSAYMAMPVASSKVPEGSPGPSQPAPPLRLWQRRWRLRCNLFQLPFLQQKQKKLIIFSLSLSLSNSDLLPGGPGGVL